MGVKIVEIQLHYVIINHIYKAVKVNLEYIQERILGGFGSGKGRKAKKKEKRKEEGTIKLFEFYFLNFYLHQNRIYRRAYHLS